APLLAVVAGGDTGHEPLLARLVVGIEADGALAPIAAGHAPGLSPRLAQPQRCQEGSNQAATQAAQRLSSGEPAGQRLRQLIEPMFRCLLLSLSSTCADGTVSQGR